jgi:RNA polymerase sigma factor (sigma-70 family)
MSARLPAKGEFAELACQRHRNEVIAYMRRRLGSWQDARDLAQEVFLRLLRVKDPSEIREPLAYLYGTAGNVLAEYRMREEWNREDTGPEIITAGIHSPTRSWHNDPLEELECRETIERALRKIPRRYRQILLMKAVDGKTHEEIARELGLSAHTVEKYFFRAAAQLRVTLLDVGGRTDARRPRR